MSGKVEYRDASVRVSRVWHANVLGDIVVENDNHDQVTLCVSDAERPGVFHHGWPGTLLLVAAETRHDDTRYAVVR